MLDHADVASPGVAPKRSSHWFEQGEDAVVGHGDALRAPGRPGGVDDVRGFAGVGGDRSAGLVTFGFEGGDFEGGDFEGGDVVAEDQHRACVLDHRRPPGGRLGRVEREVGGAGLQHAEDRDHQLGRPSTVDRDDLTPPGSAPAQGVRQLRGAAVQLTVGEGPVVADDRGGVRGGVGVGGEPVGQPARAPARTRTGAPLPEDLVALGGVQELVARDVRFGPRGQLVQQPDEVPAVPLGGVVVEEGDGVVEVPEDVAVLVGEVEREIELRGRVFGFEGLDGHARQRQDVVQRRHPGEHRLEQRGVRRAARRVDQLDDPFERQLGVVDGAPQGGADLLEQHGAGAGAGQFGPHGQGVDEEADRAGVLAAGAAVGGGHADNDVRLRGKAGQQDEPAGQDGGVQRDAVFARHRPEPRREVRAEGDRHPRAAEVLADRARPVGGQLQHRRHTVEPVPPVRLVRRRAGAGQPILLRVGVFAVGARGREVRGGAAQVSGVEDTQLAQQEGAGPAVEDDVVDGDQQDVVLVAVGEQPGPGQRSPRQVERLERVAAPQLGRFARPPGDVGDGARKPVPGGFDDLHGLAVFDHDPGAQGFVPVGESVERPLQRVPVQGTPQDEGHGLVVGGAGPVQLGNGPKALLTGRKRRGHSHRGRPFQAGRRTGTALCRRGRGRETLPVCPGS